MYEYNAIPGLRIHQYPLLGLFLRRGPHVGNLKYYAKLNGSRLDECLFPKSGAQL